MFFLRITAYLHTGTSASLRAGLSLIAAFSHTITLVLIIYCVTIGKPFLQDILIFSTCSNSMHAFHL